jgi:hypothetical protein
VRANLSTWIVTEYVVVCVTEYEIEIVIAIMNEFENANAIVIPTL